ncbi:hypothetical protein EVAR_62397_1 [Eumeta japonica]|uniref:Uncharacterized protein n=1 Tax=Eumeta variegata TaxID=151549 RepID=A0A4C1ZBI2_EUMVA|nr:hypothetical protein EVAR_62397_1 [Eumeta japonica]
MEVLNFSMKRNVRASCNDIPTEEILDVILTTGELTDDLTHAHSWRLREHLESSVPYVIVAPNAHGTAGGRRSYYLSCLLIYRGLTVTLPLRGPSADGRDGRRMNFTAPLRAMNARAHVQLITSRR